MKKLLPVFLLLSSIHCFAQDRYQLARPLIKYESVFFKDSAKLELKFAKTGAAIYYTVDNKMPAEDFAEPAEKSYRYKKPLVFKKPFTTIKAKVFCRGFEPSETITLSFAKEGKKIKKILSTAPNPKYPGSGDSTLFDKKGGIANGSSKTWMGYNSDSASFTVELKGNQPVSTVLLSFLQNEPSWIFLPELITVYYFDESRKTFLPFGREVIFNEEPSDANVNFRFISSKTGVVKTQRLLVNIRLVKKIPDWHPAKGEHAWCFIDEIKVY